MLPAMSIWTRISEALSALSQGEGLSAVFDRLRSPPERTVAFTIAVIALGAKLAKADGEVTRAEVTAFREVFQIPPADEAKAAQVYNLARRDIAGFEEYARRIRALFGANDAPLTDLVEGLFHIALADGSYHLGEDAFLQRVCSAFGFDERRFLQIRARFVPDAERDPHAVLGVAHDAPLAQVRAAWRAAVRDSHPDQMIARGVPPEAAQLAERRMVAINRAWEQISGKAEAGRSDAGRSGPAD
jgi:DnaJ like chaperone protein